MWANPQNQPPIEKPKRRNTRLEKRLRLARDIANQVQELREVERMARILLGNTLITTMLGRTIAILDRAHDSIYTRIPKV